MYLTQEEEKILSGERGEILARFMKLLVKIGERFKAERLIPVTSVQIAGISYKNIGDPGLEFLEEIANSDAKVRVLSFMNPAGMDLELWKELGISEEFATKQLRIIEALKKLGVIASATCTPYLTGMLPRFKEHIAWSESSAVVFANSVLGARTNREGAFTALASALIGKTPYYGLHLEENRKADFKVKVECKISDEAGFSALAYFVCKYFKKGIPLFSGINAGVDELKLLGASLASYGAFALYHVENLTPEANTQREIEDKISVSEDDLKQAKEEMKDEINPEIIAFGCPHASIKEIRTIFSLLEKRKIKIPVWIFTSRVVKKLVEENIGKEFLEKNNVKILTDTCPVVMPLKAIGVESVATNSGKMRFYLLNQGIGVYFAGLNEIIEKFSER